MRAGARVGGFGTGSSNQPGSRTNRNQAKLGFKWLLKLLLSFLRDR